MDLNLIIQRESEQLEKATIVQKIKAAYKLGYEVVALNVIIGPQQLNAKNKVPDPPVFHVGQEELSECAVQKKFKILTRLTAIVGETMHCHRLFQSQVAKQYDLVAVSPMEEKLFQQLCSQGEFDIMSLQLETRTPYFVKRSQFGTAAARGVFFEIQYAPCIRDQTMRRHVLANCQNIMHASKGKSIIISSGSWQPSELRSPFDAANLGLLFGLSECTARDAVFGNCKSTILHAETRRKENRSTIFSKDVKELSRDDEWLVEACTIPVGQDDSSAKEPPQKKRKRKAQQLSSKLLFS